ncbi:DUF948 domain-containing protein [Paenibacillus sp. SYP-B3998]|uniref:DUF948 domain-containing protein n=1 Tax=Paenibacillus sp. SYP-B3998 TaxID=2678564 RepID=A0A6G4A103_9BACL|nr:DUF948 domain-containing protein [Paenibacillus sp. SYP-B3998]NEW07614.1 DUF948 domain-containing protein [Paenibacillus sp. SYP-B3998]
MTWVEISVVSAAVAVIVLVGFGIRILITARNTLLQLSDAIVETKVSLTVTANQSQQLIKQAAVLTDAVHTQLQELQPCFHSIEQTGAAIGDVASVLRKASRVMNQSIQGAEKVVHTHQKRLQDAIEWTTTGIELWQRWQAHRNAKSDT